MMIEITNLSKTYGGNIEALRNITLEIGPGMFGLVGPNGAGKTSLMRILAGLLQPTGGEVSVLGHAATTSAGKIAIKKQLGYLPQALGYYPTLSAFEFLDYIALLKGIRDTKMRRQQIERILGQVNLLDVADRRIQTYSGGMKRRVGIAQALLGDPKLVIVDEPTVGLDPGERVRLRTLFASLAERCTVILSTHIIEDIGQSCRALAVLDKGQLRFWGSPAALIEQARGHVWTVETANVEDLRESTIIASVQGIEATTYRILGEPPAQISATSTKPTLEDAYMWLMGEN